METNRTTSRRALALIQIRASEQYALLSHVAGSLSRLTPISRRCRVAPTERAGKVLQPWGRCLTVLWSLVRTSVSYGGVPVKCFGLGSGFPRPRPTQGTLFIPRMNDGGFQAISSVSRLSRQQIIYSIFLYQTWIKRRTNLYVATAAKCYE
jgi:hypothetical protein